MLFELMDLTANGNALRIAYVASIIFCFGFLNLLGYADTASRISEERPNGSNGNVHKFTQVSGCVVGAER